MSLTADHLKKLACDAIDRAAGDLNQVSQEIWSHPEENYEEHHAHQVITDMLEKFRFPVQRHFLMDTGFRSVYGTNEKPNISVLCEYDALPEIGHACGHNLIAEVGVGAAIGIKAALDAAKDAGKDLGLLTVLGTPAEESGGGKIKMIRGGAFETVDVSMMAHPTHISSTDLDSFNASDLCMIRYHGKASHAAGFPWEGVNALDAAIMAYNNISVMRQQMKPTWRVHGVILNGGAKPNIIPEMTVLQFCARAPTTKQRDILKKRLDTCFIAAAQATGCKVEVEWGEFPYDNVITNPTLAALYETNGERFEKELFSGKKATIPLVASTDMGNVSYVVPSIHPLYDIGTDAINHTRPFTQAAGGPKAQPYTLTQAKALAMTAIDIYCQPHLVDKMKTEQKEQIKKEAEK